MWLPESGHWVGGIRRRLVLHFSAGSKSLNALGSCRSSGRVVMRVGGRGLVGAVSMDAFLIPSCLVSGWFDSLMLGSVLDLLMKGVLSSVMNA